MGDGLAGAEQTLTTSPARLTRCRPLPSPSPSPGERPPPPSPPHTHSRTLSRLESAEDFGDRIRPVPLPTPLAGSPVSRSPAG